METYFMALGNTRYHGTLHESRAGITFEKLNTQICVPADYLPRRPMMRRELGYMELCQFIAGIYEPEFIARVAPRVDMSLFGRSAVYGPRIIEPRDQLLDAMYELRKNPESRRAVITISAPAEPLADQPCISMLQFFRRQDQLFLTATARSWDLWFGAPHDLIVLSGLLQMVANFLDIPDRHIVVNAGSAHIYERSLDPVQQHLENLGNLPTVWSFKMPKYTSLDAYRRWAKDNIFDMNWLNGAPRGISEDWKKARND